MTDEGREGGELRDFREFAAELERQVPGMAEARSRRGAAEAFGRQVRERLRAAREARMSREECARRMGLGSEATVERIEEGEGDLTLEVLAQYAVALGMEPVVSIRPAGEGDREEVGGYSGRHS